MKNSKKTKFLFISITVLLFIMFILDILIGSVSIPFNEFLSILTGKEGDPKYSMLITTFRIPKAITALLCGAALSASGLQMQTLFRNPLAGPYILGISSGASLGVALFLLGIPAGMTFGSEILKNLGIAGAAWIGSAAILLIIFAVSLRIKDIMAILILGMMIGSGATAIVNILQYISTESSLKTFVIWTMGSLGNISTFQVKILTACVFLGLGISVSLIKSMNLMLLGENYARTMGQNIGLVRSGIFISTTLLAGTVTAFCGPIGFISTAVPHIARMIFSDADHKVLMPASIILGAIIMLICDTISQLPGTDMVIPINTVSAFVGIPVVVYVIIRNRKIG